MLYMLPSFSGHGGSRLRLLSPENEQSALLIMKAVKQVLMYGHCGSAPTDLVLGGFSDHISFMKEHFIITHTLRQSEIPG